MVGYLHRHNHNNLVVIRDEKVNEEDNMEIFSQIEKLGELKESGLLTEEEFEKAKGLIRKDIIIHYFSNSNNENNTIG